MKFPFLRLGSLGPVAVLVVLVALTPIATSTLVHAERNTAPASRAGYDAVAADPSLHNPNFDNGYWYEFDLRYQRAYPSGVWVPAGTDMQDTTQDWRLWFLNGTDIVDCDPDDDYPHSGEESVKIRSFPGASVRRQVAGLYQVITDVEPCRTYKFQMYGRSRQKEADDWLEELKVGIEPTGWHPDSANDPAVHTWPAAMVWGTPHQYTGDYGLLEVTAEALDTEITVFLYADAHGGNSHKIHWDTGSFQSVASSEDLLSDPEDRVVNTSGITNGPTSYTGDTWATISWDTSAESSNQVYYRYVSSAASPPPPSETFTYTLFIPLVNRSPSPWLRTGVDATSGTHHAIYVDNLQSYSIYEYFVVSRGFSGTSCVLWVSNVDTFSTSH